MKRLFFMLFSAAIATTSAQNITGKVTNVRGEPIAGATVQFTDPPGGSMETDTTGRFSFPVSRKGAYTLTANAPGYRSKSITVQADPRQEVYREFALERRRETLAEVTVKATQPGEDAPVAQTRLSQAEIEEKFLGQDAQYLLSQTAPSIVTYSEAGTGFSNYGGMRMRGLDQSRLNITLNGAPLNDMLDQGVFFSNFTDVANSVSGIQVQRGVGMSTHGSASYGGSINFESQNLWLPQARTNVQLSAGSFDTYRASAEYHSGVIDNKWAFYGRMTNFTSSGYRYHSGSDSWSMFLSGGYRGEKDLFQITAFNGRSQSGLSYFAVPLPQIQQDPRTNNNFEQDVDDFGQQFVQLQYTRNLSPNLNLSSSAYYGGAGGDFPFGLADSLGNFSGQINFPLQNRHYGFFAHVLYEQKNWSLKSGVHGYTFRRKNWETFIPNSVNRIYSDSSKKDELSGFFNFNYHWRKFTFTTDVQVRRAMMEFNPDRRFIAPGTPIPDYDYTFVNPSVGIHWQWNDNWAAYASYGRTGREPTKFDIFGASTRLDSSNLAGVQNENSVKAEYVNDYEAGVRYSSGKISGQANFFWMDFRDKIEPIGERVGFVQFRKNVAESFRRGVELEGRYQWSEQGYFSGFVSYIDAEIEEYAPENEASNEVFRNVTPALTPEWQGQFTAGYKLWRQLDVSFTSRFLSVQYIEPTNQELLTVPASAVLDSRIAWQFAGEHSLILRVNNILDNLYYTYGEVGSFNGQIQPAYFVQPPRNFSVMLDLRF